MPILGLLLVSFLLRVVMGFLLYFGEDEIPIYQQGLDLFLHHHLSPVGAAVIYRGTALPGSLQSLLTGLPMFFSQGMPPGPLIFVAAWNTLAVYLIYIWLMKLFPKANSVVIAGWVILSPWTLVFTQLWNPSYLPVFSAWFFLALLKLEEKPGSFWAAWGATACVIFCMQLHLSFVLLAALLGLEIIKKWRKISWLGLGLGALTASITLWPLIFSEGSTLAGPASQAKNIELHFEHMRDWLALLLRFLSFGTAELGKFVTHPGKGFGGTLALVGEYPALIPFFIVSLGGSIFLVVLALRGLFRMVRLWKWKPNTLEEYRATLTTTALGLTAVSFLFSVKGPAAHAIWILLPLAYLPAADTVSRWKVRPWMVVYQLCGLIFLFGGYPLVPTEHPSVWRVYRLALRHYPKPMKEFSGSSFEGAGVSVLYPALIKE